MADNNINIIHKNVIRKGKILSIPIGRWIEGLVFGAISAGLIWLIPFVRRIEITLMIIFFLTVFALCVRGIKNRSFVQIIIAELTFRHRRRRLHLRPANYYYRITKEKQYNESYLEKAVRVAGERKDKFVEKYRSH